jgi:hypothetical protein
MTMIMEDCPDKNMSDETYYECDQGWTLAGPDTIPLRSCDDVLFHVPLHYLLYHS